MLSQPSAAADDPIAALIEADMAEPDAEPEVDSSIEEIESHEVEPESSVPEPVRTQVVTPLPP